MNSRTSADFQNLSNQDWYTRTPQQAVELLDSNQISGLSSDRVIQKQRYFGKNELKQTGGRSKLSILRDQFTNVMLVMLIAIAIISAVLDLIHNNFPKDSLAIFTIVILNGILGYFQESRAEKALAALKRLSSTYVKVIRDGVYLMFTKGSTELILEQCDRILIAGNPQPLSHQEKQQISEANTHLASSGLRVLGFAHKPLNEVPNEDMADSAEQGLIWLGLTGMIDPPREEVKAAVSNCRQSGIRPIMITGDHPLTAMAIAGKLNITSNQEPAITGQELAKMSPQELEQSVRNNSVYARVAPEHKLRIVQALQKQRKFVAMTGDGVNDAPALKQANIGRL